MKPTKKQLRGIQCILHATHGVVGPRKRFFETAFGKDEDEFKYIIEQPEDVIFHREKMMPYRNISGITYIESSQERLKVGGSVCASPFCVKISLKIGLSSTG